MVQLEGCVWVKHNTDEMPCYEIWIKKEKDNVEKGGLSLMQRLSDDLFPLPPPDCFLS